MDVLVVSGKGDNNLFGSKDCMCPQDLLESHIKVFA